MVPSSFITSQITPDGLSPASRARSIAASVWPVRSSTPPSFAFSGKMWPGWTRSCGRERRVDRHLHRVRAVVRGDSGRDPLARLDRDREGGLEGRLVLRRHQVEAQLVAALAGQREADQAAAVRGHEVDGVRRDELGRHHEVALVLAVLRVADDDHLAVADVLDGLLDRAEGGIRHRALSFSTYFASTSTSRFTLRPGPASPSVVSSSVSGIRRHLEGLVVHGRNGKRHAVHGDRALVDDVAEQLGGRLDPDHAREALLADGLDRGVPSTWPWTRCPSRVSPSAPRELEVHPVPLAQVAE